MAHLQIFVVLIAGLAISQAFVVPQNDGTSIRDQILNQKFSFLDNIFKNSNVDVEAIKAKIKAKDGVEEAPDAIVDGDAIRDDILNNKFAFLENHLKQYNVDVNGIRDRVWASIAEKHSLAKRALPQNGPVDGIAIRDQVLEQKFAFLENLLKQFNVDVDAIKERIKASTEQHSVAKRSVPEDGIATRDQVLEQKFAFLENLLKQYNVDVSAIKERIKASTEQHSVAKRAIPEGGAVDGIAIRDQVLDQKFEYLSNYLKHLNIDFDAIKERIKASTAHSVSKRDVRAETAAEATPNTDFLTNIIDGLLGAVNTALKAVVDAVIANINMATGGILGDDMLLNLQAFMYGLVDKTFPTTSTSYTSSLSFNV